MTAFTSANPVAEELPTDAQIEDLSDLLNRRRLSGYESYVLAPQYVSVDLRIRVAAASTDFASSVAAAVLAQLQPGSLPGGSVGFFDHSRLARRLTRARCSRRSRVRPAWSEWWQSSTASAAYSRCGLRSRARSRCRPTGCCGSTTIRAGPRPGRSA
jgi:hypothetical protein